MPPVSVPHSSGSRLINRSHSGRISNYPSDNPRENHALQTKPSGRRVIATISCMGLPLHSCAPMWVDGCTAQPQIVRAQGAECRALSWCCRNCTGKHNSGSPIDWPTMLVNSICVNAVASWTAQPAHVLAGHLPAPQSTSLMISSWSIGCLNLATLKAGSLQGQSLSQVLSECRMVSTVLRACLPLGRAAHVHTSANSHTLISPAYGHPEGPQSLPLQ
jgi:hypothetical protein